MNMPEIDSRKLGYHFLRENTANFQKSTKFGRKSHLTSSFVMNFLWNRFKISPTPPYKSCKLSINLA